MISFEKKINRLGCFSDFCCIDGIYVSWIYRGGYDYKVLNNFVSMGAMFMTGFFMLSGFVISYSYSEESLIELDKLKRFYLKRAASIYPLYWAYGGYMTIVQKDALINTLMMLPIELPALQSVWHGLASYGHNGGTWFISCLLFCYILFPFINEVLKQISFRAKAVLFCFAFFVSIYTPFLCKVTGFDFIYSNYHDCIFRSLEFLMGCVLFSVVKNIQKARLLRFIGNWLAFIFQMLLLIVIVSAGVANNIGIYDYSLYSVAGIPIFSLMFITLYNVEVKTDFIYKLIKFFSDISYAFFLMQYFAWTYTPRILNSLGINNNMNRVILSLVICVGLSAIVHYCFEKPVLKKCVRVFRL